MAYIQINLTAQSFFPAICTGLKQMILNLARLFFAFVIAKIFALLGIALITLIGPVIAWLYMNQ